jgi:hypothetical protein
MERQICQREETLRQLRVAHEEVVRDYSAVLRAQAEEKIRMSVESEEERGRRRSESSGLGLGLGLGSSSSLSFSLFWEKIKQWIGMT